MTQHLRIDRTRFDESFPNRPFLIEHELGAHELFELPRLVELSQSLPERLVEYNAGDLPVSQDPSQTPRNGLSIQETIERIETCSSWLVLKHVEQDPAYAALLADCLDQVDEHARDTVGPTSQREGFIFVSSAGSVTPFHVDPEHNFLLQVRGSKTVSLFDPDDRDLVSEEKLEQFYGGAHRNVAFDDPSQEKASVFTMGPGEGLHFPVHAPHWVQNGDAVSISFSITFRSRESNRKASLYRLNNRLRRMGWKPKPVGASSFADGCKGAALAAARGAKRIIRPGS